MPRGVTLREIAHIKANSLWWFYVSKGRVDHEHTMPKLKAIGHPQNEGCGLFSSTQGEQKSSKGICVLHEGNHLCLRVWRKQLRTGVWASGETDRNLHQLSIMSLLDAYWVPKPNHNLMYVDSGASCPEGLSARGVGGDAEEKTPSETRFKASVTGRIRTERETCTNRVTP